MTSIPVQQRRSDNDCHSCSNQASSSDKGAAVQTVFSRSDVDAYSSFLGESTSTIGSNSSIMSQHSSRSATCLTAPQAPAEGYSSSDLLSCKDEMTEEDTPQDLRDRAQQQPQLEIKQEWAVPLQTNGAALLLLEHSSGASWDMSKSDSGRDAITSLKTSSISAEQSSANQASRSTRKRSLQHADGARRSVNFSHVQIREYSITIGDNPCCSQGPPLSLDWDYADDDEEIAMDVYEHYHVLPRHAAKHRCRRSLLLNATERRTRLWRAGYSLEAIDAAAEELNRDKWRQSIIGNLEPFYALQEVWQFHVKPVLYPRAKRARRLDQHLNRIEARVRAEHRSQGSSVEFTIASELHMGTKDDSDDEKDLEKAGGTQQAVIIEGMANLLEQEKETKRHAFRTDSRSNSRSFCKMNSSSGRRSNTSGISKDYDSDGGVADFDNLSHIDEDKGDDSSSESSYGIQVDNKQQDKATQIILYSLRRPHMRAFHAAWFSFFVAFFSWFAITPLLSEVQDTLGLETSDIWMSSLFGTLGTIVMRAIMGPLCDAFGARRCMAFILVLAAIPTALTGLIETSAGLSLIRFFIGIGGSSFVANQYWTSEMFTREVAGTANAMVAGWGNLGGGAANLIMGSALFPLFRWVFKDEDADEDDTTASELAWRTICIFPAILSIVTSILILCYSDDSPKGSYKHRIRSENMLVASPMESFQRAVKNWNVWILTLQYACCFGVEVTMTNATALYFKDEYGQSTVSAAGIASIFGFMNIFARALGGLGSDRFQTIKGIRGRLFWQMLTLILEGVGVGVFGYADSLAGSICALVFLSIMVQSAEGSTFGIVPYVDRRFTGSVVGIVGSGGNVGAAIFSVFFVKFSNRTAFVLMGVSAVGSAFLSFFMKTEKLAQTYAAINEGIEVEQWSHEKEQQASNSAISK